MFMVQFSKLKLLQKAGKLLYTSMLRLLLNQRAKIMQNLFLSVHFPYFESMPIHRGLANFPTIGHDLHVYNTNLIG